MTYRGCHTWHTLEVADQAATLRAKGSKVGQTATMLHIWDCRGPVGEMCSYPCLHGNSNFSSDGHKATV